MEFFYADYNGSAPLQKSVQTYLLSRIEKGVFANPNAIHALGAKILNAIDKSRRECAELLGARTNQVLFNSGASESISHVFNSVLRGPNANNNKRTIVISSIEHSAVNNCAQYFESQNFKLIKINTLPNGMVCLNHFEDILRQEKNHIALVSVMAANNETGVIQPWENIGSLCATEGIPFFSDTTQWVGKNKFQFDQAPVDYACVSGHKVGGIIGSGILLTKHRSKDLPLIFGGGQEFNQRGGTQNYLAIETLPIALKACLEKLPFAEQLSEHKLNVESKLKQKFDTLQILGAQAPRVSGTSMISLPGIMGQAVQIELESRNIFVTTSSACSDNNPVTSKVLKAMGIDDSIGRGVIRASVGNDEMGIKTLDALYQALVDIYPKLQKVNSNSW